MTHPVDGPGHGRGTGLVGRGPECALLDELIANVRSGESGVLVLHGTPGVGKSALLEYAERSATDMRVLRAVGVESEMELPFATLHHFCSPLLDRAKRLPAPQREALETVFGMRAAPAPERFLVALGVLSLLSDTAEERPLLCVVDDAQWMDHASAQVLGFVARRSQAESMGLLFGARERPRDLLGLPDLAVTGLRDADAHALLDSVTRVRLDQRVRDRFVAETRGNPLALLELPRGLSVTQLAGGFGLPHADMLPARIEESFLARIADLPDQTRLLLLVAAAEPTGDPALVWQAASRLGARPETALVDGTDGLLSFGARVIFRHPLVRSAVYRSARADERRAVHKALAEATDPHTDPDRRAWHLASAAAAPDESVAAELERSADRAQARGGPAAAAAFLRRSAALTVDTARRAERALAAANAAFRAGDLDAARELLAAAERDAEEEFQRARAYLLRSRITFAAGFNDQAPPMLLAAARRLERFDMKLARETYLVAWATATFAASDGDVLTEISRAVRELPAPDGGPGTLDLVLEGYALLVTEGYNAALPTFRKVMPALVDYPAQDLLAWGWATCGVSCALWDDRVMHETYARAVEVARSAGALTELPIYLASLGISTVMAGDLAAATAIVAESEAVAAATGMPIAQHTKLLLTAVQGKETEAADLIADTIEWASADGQTNAVTCAHWAAAVLYNGLGRYERALPAARTIRRIDQAFVAMWVLPELVEAASRVGEETVAREALQGLVDAAGMCDTDWARGILARSRALLSEGAAAEDLYREAVERFGRTRLRPELARAHLLYGEWLRRERRRAEAQEHLHAAYGMFVSIGMEAFAERARRELLVSGEAVGKRGPAAPSSDELTEQERQIALLARDGFSNSEVAARLFLSPRTVEWHLRKVFTKLAITSRRQLRTALPVSEYEATAG
ncbi:AAA family ATPase [Streptomyces sp. HPF1205]|uniref:ATP-binding protein n=1 Tax=Streptomyces sp. HPF1205 TaxID=2873262 RepID=UPI001CEC8860|nr:LuxR family transcriptional regulator [Streptomyces sp. HPF1205]